MLDFAISDVECLIRWKHPTRDVLAPQAIMDVAATIGILGEIDAIALRKSVHAVVALEADGHYIPKLGVNVSLERLRDPKLIFAIDCLPKTRAQLAFEVLETVFIDELDARLKDFVVQLKGARHFS